MKRTAVTTIVIFCFALNSYAQTIKKQLNSVAEQISQKNLKSYIEKLVSFHNRNTFSDTASSDRGVGAARKWLFEELQKINQETGGRMRIEFDYFFHKLSSRQKRALETDLDSVKLANVLAFIPGTKSSKMLVICGHYDSRAQSGYDVDSFAPGANDDGSGTVALLELARVLAPLKLPNTILLAAVVGEEQGLLGSRHLAERAKAENWQIEGVIANDMIGNIIGGNGKTDDTILRCFSPDPPESPSRNLALYFKKINDKFFPKLKLKLIFRLDRFGRGGDHSPFIREGFAGVRFTEPYENYEHQHSQLDTPENMSFEYFKKTTQLNAVLAAYWANSPGAPTIVSIRRDSIYQTVISLICNENKSELKGFTIFKRETDRGYWQEEKFFELPEPQSSRRFGEVFRLVMPDRDMDYYIFGAAAVNKAGYESIIATYDREKLRQFFQRSNTNRRGE